MGAPEQAPEGGEARMGVFASLRRALGTLVALAHTRLDLLSTELEEQGERIVSVLLWGVAAGFVASSALLLCALLALGPRRVLVRGSRVAVLLVSAWRLGKVVRTLF
jgi:uncharacterized membrane protein YqjE